MKKIIMLITLILLLPLNTKAFELEKTFENIKKIDVKIVLKEY